MRNAPRRLFDEVTGMNEETFLRLLLSPEGRIRRGHWWYGVGTLCGLLSLPGWAQRLFAASSKVSYALLPLYLVVLAWPAYCVHAKRFQDRGKPPGFALAFVGLQFIAVSVAGSGYRPLDLIAAGVAACLTLWVVIELGVLKGTGGLNRFGEEPA